METFIHLDLTSVCCSGPVTLAMCISLEDVNTELSLMEYFGVREKCQG